MTSLDDYMHKFFKLEKENSWVTVAEKEPLLTLIESTQKQLEKLYEEQKNKPKSEDPVIWVINRRNVE